MKRFCLLLLAAFAFLSVSAQTEGASKLYGYKQKIRRGTVRVDDSGREKSASVSYNYFIYLASSAKVVPIAILIKGEAYAVTASEVKLTPVEFTVSGPTESKTRILVPQTTKKVVQLTPSSTKIKKPSQKAKALADQNELVVLYKEGNQCYYKTVSKFSELEPIEMQ